MHICMNAVFTQVDLVVPALLCVASVATLHLTLIAFVTTDLQTSPFDFIVVTHDGGLGEVG